MNANWTRTTLSHVADINPEKTPRWDSDHPIRYVDIASVSAEHGIDVASIQPQPFGGAPGRARRRIRSGDILISTVRPNLRAFARVPQSLDGEVASTGFAVLRAKPGEIDPGFLWCVVQTENFVDDMVSRCTGSNYPAIRAADVGGHKFSLPPLPVQRRIADLVEAVDTNLLALRAEERVAVACLDVLIAESMSTMPTRTPLGDLAATRSGPSYAASDVSEHPLDGAVPVIGIPNTKPDGSLDLSSVGYVSGLPRSVGKVDDSSLILIRTNGNRQRIGNVYLPTDEAHGHAVSAFQFLMKVHVPEDREYLYWALRDPEMQTAMSDAASGTTGLGNLAVKWLNSALVPWSDQPEVRRRVTAPLRSMQEVVDALHLEVKTLQSARSTLLTSLLTACTEIPATYDRLLTEVA